MHTCTNTFYRARQWHTHGKTQNWGVIWGWASSYATSLGQSVITLSACTGSSSSRGPGQWLVCLSTEKKYGDARLWFYNIRAFLSLLSRCRLWRLILLTKEMENGHWLSMSLTLCTMQSLGYAKLWKCCSPSLLPQKREHPCAKPNLLPVPSFCESELLELDPALLTQELCLYVCVWIFLYFKSELHYPISFQFQGSVSLSFPLSWTLDSSFKQELCLSVCLSVCVCEWTFCTSSLSSTTKFLWVWAFHWADLCTPHSSEQSRTLSVCLCVNILWQVWVPQPNLLPVPSFCESKHLELDSTLLTRLNKAELCLCVCVWTFLYFLYLLQFFLSFFLSFFCHVTYIHLCCHCYVPVVQIGCILRNSVMLYN